MDIVRGITVAHFRLHYRAMVTQPAWKGRPNRRVSQQNRRVRSEHSVAT